LLAFINVPLTRLLILELIFLLNFPQESSFAFENDFLKYLPTLHVESITQK
jgi:hypothetical protein